MKFNDLTLRIYTFFKVRDSLVLFLIGLALLTTGMHEISLSQSGINIPRGAPPATGNLGTGAPESNSNFGEGAPNSDSNFGEGAPALNGSLAPVLQAQGAPFIQGRPGIFIQGRLAPGLNADTDGEVNTALGAEPLLEAIPAEFIEGTPDQFLDSQLAQASDEIRAEDLLQAIPGQALDADGLAEEPAVEATGIAESADIPFDDSLIRFSVGNLFKFIEGAFGALLVVGSGIGAIIAATVGAYKMALGLLVTSVGAFILRAYVSLFFGTDYPDFDSVNFEDF